MSARPDFVIAGAAKCGTTALYTYLARHASVFMPDLKEPGFFSVDMPGGMTRLEEYHALFARAAAESLTGEASSRYLYSRVAIDRLMIHNPGAKVIVMLRDPVEAAYSLHGYAYRYGHEDEADFERAWRAQGADFACEESIAEYDYRARYRYAGQVRRLIERVPHRQRLILIYEEFFAEPRRHYATVLDFLGLAPTSPPSFTAVNTYVDVRSHKLEQLLRRPPALIRAAYAPLRPMAKAAGVDVRRIVTRLNRFPGRKKPLRTAFRRELEQYFAGDVKQLESLLGRPLWRATESERPVAQRSPADRTLDSI